MILSVNNINKSFSENIIVKNGSFFLNEYDKAALVGINGSGKTTLLRIIMGELTPDSGTVVINKDKEVGYLPQNAILDSDNTIYKEVMDVKSALLEDEKRLRDMESRMGDLSGKELDDLMSAYHTAYDKFERDGGNMIVSEVNGTLKGLDFPEEMWEQPVKTLSGGQKTRVALAKLLVSHPDIIILDEPTNHLDLDSIIWLENYLLNYKGTVLIVSHDRYFLDKITNKIIEVENGNCMTFDGNYSSYAVKKENLRIAALNAYINQQRDIEHQKEVISKLKSFNREKSIRRAESRQKMLDKMDVLDKPVEIDDKMQIILSPGTESGKDVLHVENLKKTFDSNKLFENISFDIKKGDHVALLGQNGTGKTTILKIINDLIPCDEGKIDIGANVHIGYYDQEHHVLHDDKTIFEEISDDYPSLNNTEIRNVLAAFLFTGDDVFKQIKTLSGGEKGRVSLAKLMLSEANFLILDEPTNHLDITSKEILEDALNNYTGTVLYVSHDRYFINRTAHRIMDLSDKCITEYLGDYDYYIEKRAELNPVSASSSQDSSSTASISQSKGAEDYKAQKAMASAMKKTQKELDKIEKEIDVLETKIKELEEVLADPKNGSNTALLISSQKELDENNIKLEELMEKWEELQ